MDSLARRINYMTNKIASMSEDGSREGSASRDTQTKTEKLCNGDGSEDSGLSSRDASRIASEINTPDDDHKMGLDMDGKTRRGQSGYTMSPTSPLSPDSASSGSPTKVASPSKEDKLDLEADACLIEESRRGITILRALQERHRRSLILEESTAAEISKTIKKTANSSANMEADPPAAQSITTDV